MYFVFNEISGQVGRVPELTGNLKNRKFVRIGPSVNNRRAPVAYASDNLTDFQRQMYKRGQACIAQMAGKFAATNFIGWSDFYV